MSVSAAGTTYKLQFETLYCQILPYFGIRIWTQFYRHLQQICRLNMRHKSCRASCETLRAIKRIQCVLEIFLMSNTVTVIKVPFCPNTETLFSFSLPRSAWGHARFGIAITQLLIFDF
jgi:hypothetical protein